MKIRKKIYLLVGLTVYFVPWMAFGQAKVDLKMMTGPTGGAGRAPFKAPTKNVMQLANLYPQYFQMVVLENSPIKSVADLKGKAICPGPKGHTGELLAQQVLQIYGLSYKDMRKVDHVQYSDSVNLMKDGHADAFILGTTIPGSSILDLGTS